MMGKNPLLVWVENNRKKEGFGNSLVQLLTYACTDWIRRECSVSLTGTDGLSWFLAKAPSEIPMGEWVQNPEMNAEAIVEFCERSKTAPIPESLKVDFPKVLDLRGVVCPGNSVRARLVMGARHLPRRRLAHRKRARGPGGRRYKSVIPKENGRLLDAYGGQTRRECVD